MEKFVRIFVSVAGSLLLLAGLIAFVHGRIPVVGSFVLCVFGLLCFAVYFYPGVPPMRAFYFLILWLFVFWGIYHLYFQPKAGTRAGVVGGFIAVLLLMTTFHSESLALSTRSVAGDSLFVVALFLLPASAVSSKGGLLTALLETLYDNLIPQSVAFPSWLFPVVEKIIDFFRYEYSAYGLLMLAYLTAHREKFPEHTRVPPVCVQLTLTFGAFASVIAMLIRAINGLLTLAYEQFFPSMAMGFLSFGLFWIGANSFRRPDESPSQSQGNATGT